MADLSKYFTDAAAPVSANIGKFFDAPEPAPAPVPVAADPSLMDYAKLSFRGLTREAPLQMASTIAGMIEGPEGVEPANPDIGDRIRGFARRSGEEYAQEVQSTLGDTFKSEMVQAIPSLGYSAATLPVTAAATVGGAALGGALGLPTGPGALTTAGAGVAAGIAGGYLAMDRAAQAQILGDLAAQEETKMGRAFTAPEFAAFKADLDDKVAAYGGWEAGPEALSNVIDLAILRRVPGAGALTDLAKKALGIAATELPTETTTQIGQSQALEGTSQARPDGPLSFTSPQDVGTAAREVLPGVIVVGGGMTVANAALEAVADKVKGNDAPAAELRQRALDIAKFKAQNPDVELPEGVVENFLAGNLTGEGNEPVTREAQMRAERQAQAPEPFVPREEIMRQERRAAAAATVVPPAPELMEGEIIDAMPDLFKEGSQAQEEVSDLRPPNEEGAGVEVAPPWHAVYANEPDPFMRKDLLERVANSQQATAQDMRDAVERIAGEDYKDTNVLWAIASNKATDPATKEAALALREEVMAPGYENAPEYVAAQEAAALETNSVNPLTTSQEAATLPETSKGEAMNQDIETVRTGKLSPFSEVVRRAQTGTDLTFAVTPESAKAVIAEAPDGVLFAFGGTGEYLVKEGGKLKQKRLGEKETPVTLEDAAISLAAASKGVERRAAPTPLAGKPTMPVTTDAERLFTVASAKLPEIAGRRDLLLQVAEGSAKLDGKSEVSQPHLAEAVQYVRDAVPDPGFGTPYESPYSYARKVEVYQAAGLEAPSAPDRIEWRDMTPEQQQRAYKLADPFGRIPFEQFGSIFKSRLTPYFDPQTLEAVVPNDASEVTLSTLAKLKEPGPTEAPPPKGKKTTPPAGKQDVEATPQRMTPEVAKADIQAFVAANPQITTPVELSKALYEAQGNELQVNSEYVLGVQRQAGETQEAFRKRRHALYATFLPGAPPTKEAKIRAERQAQAAGLAPTSERRGKKEAKVEAQEAPPTEKSPGSNTTRTHFTVPANAPITVPEGTIFREDVTTGTRGANKGKKTTVLSFKKPGETTFTKIEPTPAKLNTVGTYEKVMKSERIETNLEVSQFTPSAEEAATVEAGVEGKTVVEAAQWLTDNAPDPSHKLIAAKVVTALESLTTTMGFTISMNVDHVGDRGPSMLARGARGTFLLKGLTGEVWLNGADTGDKTGMSYRTALHELIHAATTPVLVIAEMKNARIAKELNMVFDATRQHFNKRLKELGPEGLTEFEQMVGARQFNVLEDTRELITSALTLPEMQEYLESIPFSPQMSVWTRFIRALRSYFGLPETAETALSEVLRISEKLLNPSSVITMVRADSSSFGGQSINGPSGTEINEFRDLPKDPEKLNKLFSETPKKNLQALKDSLLSGRVTTQALPAVLKVTPLGIVADLADAAGLPWVRTFYKATMQRDAVSNGIVTDFGLLGKELAKTKETAKLVAGVADVASIHQMKPQDDIYSQDWIAAAMRGAEDTKAETKESLLKGAQTAWEAAGMQESTGKTFREAYQAAKQAYDALPQDLQDQYLDAVGKMKALRQREKDAAQALIEEYTQNNPELRAEQIAQLNTAYNNLKGNYWPVYRKGDYTLDYVETATGLRGYSTFDTVFEREVVAKSMVDAGVVDAASLRLSKRADTPPGSFGIPQGYNMALGKAIEDKAIAAATQGIDPKNTQAMDEATAQARQNAQNTIQTLHEVWLRFQPEASAAKNMMRRKNIKGYDGDMVRGFLEYGQTHAVRVAQMEQGRKIEKTLNEMATAIRGMTGDTTRAMAILNDLRAREAVKSQPSHWLTKKLGVWTTFKYMTSPSIALVQMTQLGILTFPKLATLEGSTPARAAAALSRGTQAAFSTKFTRARMYGETEVQLVFDSLHEVVTSDLRRKNPGTYDDVPLGTPVYTKAELQSQIDRLSPYQQQLLALHESMDRGLLDISLAHEVNEQVERKEMNPIAGKVFDLGMTFMRESEKASRKAAILAAFEVGGGTTDFFAGMDTVEEVVDSTLFNYSKSAKGVALQGDLVRVLTTFQTFRINAIGKLFVLFRQTIKGETPEVQQAAKRELLGIFGMSGILAGVLGMPLGPAVFALFDAIVGDDDDEPSEEQFRKWLAENFGQTAADVAVEGVPSLLGASLSRRIGLGDVVGTSAEMPARLVGDGAMNWVATQIAGPSYSMAAGYAKGYNEIFNEGEIIKGLISSTPKLIGDALKAYGYATDGVKTGMGKRLLTAEQVDANEALLQAFGFAPLEISRLRREQYDLGTRSTRLSMQWGQIKQDVVRAYVDGEPTEAGLEKMREFMTKHPGLVQNAGAEIRGALREYLLKDLGVDSRRETLLKR